MVILSIILFFTVFEALHEGLQQKKLHRLSGLIEGVKLLGLVVLVPLLLYYSGCEFYLTHDNVTWKFWQIFLPDYIIGWVAIRYAIFDYIYNIAAGNPVEYVGNTKILDKYVLQEFNKMWGVLFFRTTRIIALVLGIHLITRI